MPAVVVSSHKAYGVAGQTKVDTLALGILFDQQTLTGVLPESNFCLIFAGSV